MLSLKLLYKSSLASFVNGFRKRKKKEVIPALDDPTLESDPLRAEYVKSVPGAQLFRGVLLQGYLAPPDVLLEGLEDMPIKDDVFVITYPKSDLLLCCKKCKLRVLPSS